MKPKFRYLALVGLLSSSVAVYAQTNPPAGELPAKAATAVIVASADTTTNAASADDPAPTDDKTPAGTSGIASTNATTQLPDESLKNPLPTEVPAPVTPGDAAPEPDATPKTSTATETPAETAKVTATNGVPQAENPTKTEPAAETPVVAAADAAPGAKAQPESAALEAPATTTPVIAANTPAPTPVTATPVSGVAASPSNAVIPLIVMDDVPLTDAIKNLARQAGLNYMLDPKISFGQPGPDNRPGPQPSVSIRWENITAEQALNALLNNNNLQLVDDPKTHIARVTVKDPAAPDPLVTRIIQLKYANPSNILASVAASLSDKRSKVIADVRTSQLVVLATDRELVSVDELVDRLDTQTKQVLIEARLVETSFNPTTTKGIDWTGTLQAQHLAFGNNLQQNTPQQSLNNTLANTFPKLLFDTAKGFNPATAFLDADGVNAVFSFLNTDSEAKVLSAPRTVTLDNEMASISVTRASPIFKNTAGTQGSPGGSEVTYTNLGVLLNVTPRISANNFVNLRVVPEVSRVFDTVRKTVASTVNEADEYDIRKIDTHVMIPSGNTLVLGGMVQDDVRNSHTKVPFFGDLPLVGAAFRTGSKSRQKSNLLIFITPTIVTDQDYQPTKTDYLHTPVPTQDSIDGEWSSWDSGKPKDWSKPAYDEAKFQAPGSTK